MAQQQTEKSIVLCLDFDGTLTNLEGSQLVFGEFYQSLLIYPSCEYKTTPLRDDIQALFQAQFGEKFDPATSYAKDMASALISKAALLFLFEALQHPEVKINIITRNRADYIRALMSYQGFEEAQISKIRIFDNEGKNQAARQTLDELDKSQTHVIICDDNLSDGLAMKTGVSASDVSEDYIHLYHFAAGQFRWADIQTQLKDLLPAPSFIAQENSDSKTEEPSLTLITPAPSFIAQENSDSKTDDQPIHSITPAQNDVAPKTQLNDHHFFSRHAKIIAPGFLALSFIVGSLTTALVSIPTIPIILGILAALAVIVLIQNACQQKSEAAQLASV